MERVQLDEAGLVRSQSFIELFSCSPIVAGAVVLLGLLLVVTASNAQGQSLEVEGEGGISLWPRDDRCYQHSMNAAMEMEAKWAGIFAEGFLRVQWWGACDTEVRGSILNAEAGKALERWHGANAGIEFYNLQLGLTMRRDAVHHIWRNGDRTGHFPEDGSVYGAMHRCRNGGSCPSIGYHEGVGGYIGYEGNGIDISLTTPPYRWRDLTLPWSDWTLDGFYEWGGWRIGVSAQAGGITEPTLDGGISRRVLRNVWIGIHGGRLQAPGWREPIERVALSLSIL